jgi:SMC interacting uncharacterized protein involved in chromosome segregation
VQQKDALREKEAAYNAIKRSAGADVQAMQAEAAALSREVTRWREHHAQLKTQLEKREREVQLMKESSRATATDADSKLRQVRIHPTHFRTCSTHSPFFF